MLYGVFVVPNSVGRPEVGSNVRRHRKGIARAHVGVYHGRPGANREIHGISLIMIFEYEVCLCASVQHSYVIGVVGVGAEPQNGR